MRSPAATGVRGESDGLPGDDEADSIGHESLRGRALALTAPAASRKPSRRALARSQLCPSRSGRYNHAVPRPLPKSALERLGRRIVATDHPERADILQLHELLAGYGPVLASAVERVSAKVGIIPSSRVKTTGTIIEKLRRNGGHTLSSIHDLGGMRLVVTGGRAAQDRMAEGIREAFADGDRAPRLIDRRLTPVHGYRV